MRAPRLGGPGTQTALAGLAAAELAAVLGKLQRNRDVKDEELLRIERAARSAEACTDMLEGKLSYWEFASNSGAYEKMYEEAIISGLVPSGGHLKGIAASLRLLAEDEKGDFEALTELHSLFSNIANAINVRFTSSGEGAGA